MLKVIIASLMLLFASVFSLPAMAVDAQYNLEQISYVATGDSVVALPADMDIRPGLVKSEQRTMTVAYTATGSKQRFNINNINPSCTGYHKTGYSSNEVGWL